MSWRRSDGTLAEDTSTQFGDDGEMGLMIVRRRRQRRQQPRERAAEQEEDDDEEEGISYDESKEIGWEELVLLGAVKDGIFD